MRTTLLIAVFLLLLSGCKKETTNNVYIRIQNSTFTTFSKISVGNSDYINLAPSAITDYKLITEPVYTVWCNATIKDSSFYIGYLTCGTPMPQAFKNGRYTFIIKSSVSNPGAGAYEIELKNN